MKIRQLRASLPFVLPSPAASPAGGSSVPTCAISRGWHVAAAALVATLVGCAGADDTTPPVGPPSPVDAASIDAGVTGRPPDGSAPPDFDAARMVDSIEGPGVGAAVLDTSAAERAGCYDGIDNDRNGIFDCADPGCATLPSCCVVAGSIDCCTNSETVTLPIDAVCTGSVAACARSGEVTSFGDPAPRFDRGALLPLGDDTGDSGALLEKPFDPSLALVVRGTLTTPVGDCGPGCFESVGLGLVTDGAPGPLGSVRPWVGVVASAARASLSLVIGGEVVDSISIAGSPTVEVVLTVLPSGSVRLEARTPGIDEPLGTRTTRVTPRTERVRLALFGRGRNVAGRMENSSVRDVGIESRLCGAPERWLTRDPLATPATAPASPSAPSVAYGDGQTLLAWAEDGNIQLRVLPGERLAAGVDLPSNGPLLSTSEVNYGDPDVHFDVTPGGVALGYTLYVANRTTRAIERVALRMDGTPRGAPLPFAVPAELGLADADVVALDGPSVLRPAMATSDIPHLFARARLSSGETRIVRFAMSSDAPDASVVRPTDLASATVRVPQPGFGAFDRDEVAAPSVYRHDGGVQLAFAGRSGARWAIGLMSTDLDDFSAWHTEPTTPILAGDADGFDALTVRDPAVVARGKDIQMLYVGSNGASDVLGLATRTAPDRTLGP
jgi:hypothetical protein